MTENEIATRVLDAAFKVHTAYGPGLMERVYLLAMEQALKEMGLHVSVEHPIPVFFGEVRLEVGYRADLIVEGKVIVELKSIETVPPVVPKIVLTYLRFANLRLGLILNFGEEHLKNGIQRVVNGL